MSDELEYLPSTGWIVSSLFEYRGIMQKYMNAVPQMLFERHVARTSPML